jgi:hypothetical protein
LGRLGLGLRLGIGIVSGIEIGIGIVEAEAGCSTQ